MCGPSEGSLALTFLEFSPSSLGPSLPNDDQAWLLAWVINSRDKFSGRSPRACPSALPHIWLWEEGRPLG